MPSSYLAALCLGPAFSLRRCTRLAAFLPLLAGSALVSPVAAAEAGSLTGSVSNIATGNLLQGAKVEVPQLGLTTLTDDSGRFVLNGVPAGTHEIVVTYIGLDPARGVVAVAAGQRAVRDFDLTTGIYKLDAFKVTGEREGGAAAITAQRNAPNVTNVVAMDSFGNLPNMSAGEVLMRLPGVAGSPTDEGLAYNFNIRGMGAGLNTVTIDGGLVTSLGSSRAFEMQSISGALFDQLELVKGHRPDKNADSLGGTVNLKSRSSLSMREKRRVTYSFSSRIAPSFVDQIPMREQHRSHPLINFGYQELFDIFGGKRNIGINVNLFYSENAVGFFQTDRDYQNTTTQPAYVWSYQTFDNYNNRKQASINIKTDYRLTANTKVSVNATVNDNYEDFRRRYITRAYSSQNQNTVPSATTSVVPGFTDKITVIRPVATSLIEMQNRGPNNYAVRMRRLDLAAEQDFGPLQLDYAAYYARTNLNNGNGHGGELTHRLTGAGWILDRTDSELHPRFIQNGGPDFTDPTNYRPTGQLLNSNGHNDQRVREARFNAMYKLPTSIPLSIKTGAQWRETLAQTESFNRRWNYLGTTSLPADPSMITYDQVKTGRRMPQWTTSMFIDERTPKDPTLWSEDLYYALQQRYTGTRSVTETVTAGYFMAQGKFGKEGILGRTSFLGGVRMEKTDDDSFGWVRARIGSTTAQQVADPVGSATRDYAGTRRVIEGSYTKSFPSIHLTHDITPNLKARLSWSTSFGRPGFGELFPNETVNENAQTLTINNASLLPQNAKNWDASLDYYFEPVGNFSVGFFTKTIKDFIVRNINVGTVASGQDNGYNGDYAGFTEFTSANAGTAYVQGWEFSYQQQFTFLPGLLKGLSGSVNYTQIDTHGDFGGATYLSGGQVVGFIPKAANVMLSWRYKRFSTRVLYNWTGDYIVEYSAATVGRNRWRRAMDTVNLGLAYQLNPKVNLTCDVSNLFNEPQQIYRGFRNQPSTIIYNFITVNVGVNGRF
ncbi:TonB-dependent receptor [Horticoccus sp. 23ND18S-11]|uniref:TonB-dependent receptor n=1 Tax=Horticoccus sp. 23ND18S-11 TaxID=3391832 RepID=UPI0039C96587